MAVSDQATWTIRHARPEDGRPVRRFVFDILNEYRVAADPDDSDADVMAVRRRRGRARRAARRGGRRRADRLGDPRRPTARAEIKLSKLFLKPEFRGLGLGREMLARAEAEASERGYRRISLGTRALYVEAVRLYERRRLDARPRPAAARARTASTTATSRSSHRSEIAAVAPLALWL